MVHIAALNIHLHHSPMEEHDADQRQRRFIINTSRTRTRILEFEIMTALNHLTPARLATADAGNPTYSTSKRQRADRTSVILCECEKERTTRPYKHIRYYKYNVRVKLNIYSKILLIWNIQAHAECCSRLVCSAECV